MATSQNTLRLPEWPHGVEEASTPRVSDFEVAFGINTLNQLSLKESTVLSK